MCAGIRRRMTVGVTSRTRGAWLAAAALCAGATAISLWLWFWPGGIPSGTTSGVWSALAYDNAGGLFYRPLHEAGYYGGTRYMPLFFVLQSGAIRLGADPVHSGVALCFAAVLLFDGALFGLLLRQGLGALPSLAWSVLAHASLSYQLVTLEIRCDVLAAAFSLWGLLAAGVGSRAGRWAACALFTAAFATKFTALAGISGVLLWKLMRRDWRGAMFYASVTGAAMLAVAWIVNRASDGRALASFAACATGAGGLAYALRAPEWLLLALAQDPFLLALLACAAWQAWEERGSTGLPTAFLVAASAISAAVFVSAGTGTNHLLEPLAASVVVLGGAWARGTHPRRWSVLLGVLTGAQLLCWTTPVPTVRSVISKAGRPTRDMVGRIRNRLKADPRPVLSENPLLPILMGTRPVVLDAFALRILAQRDAAVDSEFRRRIEDGAFSAVILLDWSGAPVGDMEAAVSAHGSNGVDTFYGGVHFPQGFLALLRSRYSLAFVERPYVVYLPRPLEGRP
jgi:hypothetical protein